MQILSVKKICLCYVHYQTIEIVLKKILWFAIPSYKFLCYSHSLLLLLIFLASSWYPKAKIGLWMSLRNKKILIRPKKKKKVVLFPEIGQVKFFLITYPPEWVKCVREYIVFVSKKTRTQAKKFSPATLFQWIYVFFSSFALSVDFI